MELTAVFEMSCHGLFVFWKGGSKNCRNVCAIRLRVVYNFKLCCGEILEI